MALPQVLRHDCFQFFRIDVPPCRVIGELFAVYLVYREVTGLLAAEDQAAGRFAGRHHVRFGQRDAGRFGHPHQPEDVLFHRVIRARGVAECRADTPVPSGEQLFRRECVRFFVSPQFGAHPPVQRFGEGFGQPVAEQLGHDGAVVVVVAAETFGQFVQTDARRYGERADVVCYSAACRSDEVGQRQVRFVVGLLVAQLRQPQEFLPPAVVCVQHDVVAVAGRRVNSDDAVGPQPFVVDDLL